MVKIKDKLKNERLREKPEKYGAEKLRDAELLAILLRTGMKESVLREAKTILGRSLCDICN